MRTIAAIALALLGGALAGCASTSHVQEIGKHRYTATASSDGTRAAMEARQQAFEAGERTCAESGRQFVLLDERMSRTRMGIDTTFDVTFLCASKEEAERLHAGVGRRSGARIDDRETDRVE